MEGVMIWSLDYDVKGGEISPRGDPPHPARGSLSDMSRSNAKDAKNAALALRCDRCFVALHA